MTLNLFPHATALAALLLATSLHANPKGGQVTVGNVTITEGPGAMTITQGDRRAIIHWQDFSIGVGELTQFLQPDSKSATLNRVTGGIPSSILGTLKANGQVFLINPNGVLVGPSGVINTAGFVASTLDVPDAQFMAGGAMNFSGTSMAGVVNLGSITATDGDVILMARTVENAGTINAPNGVAALAAGNDILLQAVGDERVVVKSGIAGGGTGVSNSGTINAAQAELKAAGGNVYALAVNNTGIVKATGIAQRNGRVILSSEGGVVQNSGQLVAKNADGSGGTVKMNGGKGGAVVNNGLIDAAATNNTKPGGIVEILGDTVTLGSSSVINASGSDGGVVAIGVTTETAALATEEGGIATLAANPDAKAAQQTAIHANSVILANATNTGKGGRIVVWSDQQSTVGGVIEAKGGELGGDGGLVESSGKLGLTITPGTKVNTSAPQGRAGTWLLDPAGISIENSGVTDTTGFNQDSNTNTVLASDILFALKFNGNVTIKTTGFGAANSDIVVNAPLIDSTITNVRTLTLDSAGGIRINQGIDISNTLVFLVLKAASGEITFGADVHMRAVTATASGDIIVSNSITADSSNSDVLISLKSTAGKIIVANGAGNSVLSPNIILDGNTGVLIGASGTPGFVTTGNIGSSNVELFSGAHVVIGVDSSITTNNGAQIILNAVGDITLESGALLGTETGGGIFLTSSGGAIVNNAGFIGVAGLRTTLLGGSGNIFLRADAITFNGPVRAGSIAAGGQVTLAANTAVNVDVGTTGFTQAELDNVVSKFVTIDTGGKITVSSNITPTTFGRLTLRSTGDEVSVNANVNMGAGDFTAQADGQLSGTGKLTAQNVRLRSSNDAISYTGILDTSFLGFNSFGSTQITNAANKLGSIGGQADGGFDIVNGSGNLTITESLNGGLSNRLKTTGNFTIGLFNEIIGGTIILDISGGNFINNGGINAIQATNRFIVYSADQNPPHNTGGLLAASFTSFQVSITDPINDPLPFGSVFYFASLAGAPLAPPPPPPGGGGGGGASPSGADTTESERVLSVELILPQFIDGAVSKLLTEFQRSLQESFKPKDPKAGYGLLGVGGSGFDVGEVEDPRTNKERIMEGRGDYIVSTADGPRALYDWVYQESGWQAGKKQMTGVYNLAKALEQMGRPWQVFDGSIGLPEGSTIVTASKEWGSSVTLTFSDGISFNVPEGGKVVSLGQGSVAIYDASGKKVREGYKPVIVVEGGENVVGPTVKQIAAGNQAVAHAEALSGPSLILANGQRVFVPQQSFEPPMAMERKVVLVPDANGKFQKVTLDVPVIRPAAASSGLGKNLNPAQISNIARLAGLSEDDVSNIVSAGGGKFTPGVVAAIVAGGGGNLSGTTIARIVAAGGGNVVSNDGVGIVAGGGGNISIPPTTMMQIITAGIVAGGGANIVAAGGGNMVAGGGSNIVAGGGLNFSPEMVSGIVAAGGGNLGNMSTTALASMLDAASRVVSNDGAGVLSNDGAGFLGIAAGIVAVGLVGNDGSSLIGHDGGSFLGNVGASLVNSIASSASLAQLSTLVGAGGSTLVGAGGSTLVGAGGSTLVGAGGSTLVGAGGSTLVGAGGSTLVGAGGSTLVGAGGSTLVGAGGSTLVGAGGSTLVGAGGSTLITPGGAMIGQDGSSLIPNGAAGVQSSLIKH